MNRYIFKTVCRAATAVLLAVSLLFLCSCAPGYGDYTAFAMGSVLTARIYGDSEAADKTWEEITRRVNNADALLSATDENSDISRLARDGRIFADEFTVRKLGDAVTVCNICGRKLDVTLGAVTELWGFATDSPSLPDAGEIAGALALRDMDGILTDAELNMISVNEGQKVDLGAVGKGIACDEAYAALLTQEASAVLSFGGTVLLFGRPPAKDAWTVGIRDPFGSVNDYFATLSFSDIYSDMPVFISTSGSYEKTFEADGKKYHHLLDPQTGYPVENGLAGVTVVSGAGLNSDALSTACFVNGLNSETEDWLDCFNAGAVFVFDDGRVYVTENLRDSFSLQSDGFTLIDSYDAA